jgi:putative Holliday junction resolvase
MYLACDIGEKNTGLAKSDDLAIISTEIGVVDTDKLILKLRELIKEHYVEKVIIGLPLNMKSQETEQTKFTKKWGSKIKNECNIDIDYVDERFTSKEAISIINKAGVKLKKVKSKKDSLAAQIILKAYLDINH